MTQAIILAGGKGERLLPLTTNIPKPLIEFNGKPILHYQIEALAAAGLTEIVICGHYLFEKIKESCGDGSMFGVSITYVDDGDMPLGSGGAVKNAENYIRDDAIVINGDTITDIDFSEFVEYHKRIGNLVTAVVRQTDHPHDSDIVKVEGSKVTKFFDKTLKDKEGNIAIAGIFVMNKKALEKTTIKHGNLERDVIAPLIEKGHVTAFLSEAYMKDVGTFERLEKASNDIPKNGQAITLLLEKRSELLKKLKTVETSGFIEAVADKIAKVHEKKGTILFLGNGGSYFDACHIAEEFMTGLYRDKDKCVYINVLVPSPGGMTAVVNDAGSQTMFSHHVMRQQNIGLVIGYSTSGNAQNVIDAFKVAKSKNIPTVGLTGGDGGYFKREGVCDHLLIVPDKNTARVQEAHKAISHVILGIVHQKLGYACDV